MPTIQLNESQQAAINTIKEWVADTSPLAANYFLLNGAAGTGKTTAMRELVKVIPGKLCYTAPTNKATKVLANLFTGTEFQDIPYKPDSATIYSLLGLRMVPNGGVKELAASEIELEIDHYAAIIVDECSMINDVLWGYIRDAMETGIKFIFIGDAWQLPPVNQKTSPVWGNVPPFHLGKVMRHDGPILQLANHIRSIVDHPAPPLIVHTNTAPVDGEVEEAGVRRVVASDFYHRMLELAKAGEFSIPDSCKAVAWRNITVDNLNGLIRSSIFPKTGAPWVQDDRIIVVEPVMVEKGRIVATTDSEATIEDVQVINHPRYSHIKCFGLTAVLDAGGGAIPLVVLHPDSNADYLMEINSRQAAAKVNSRLWRDFWAFRESFHQIKYGYAITAHRSQGSTYNTVFVDMGDILRNRVKSEAMRCLYVACSRAKKNLIVM